MIFNHSEYNEHGELTGKRTTKPLEYSVLPNQVRQLALSGSSQAVSYAVGRSDKDASTTHGDNHGNFKDADQLQKHDLESNCRVATDNSLPLSSSPSKSNTTPTLDFVESDAGLYSQPRSKLHNFSCFYVSYAISVHY